MQKLTVTKVDAAERQLQAAIRLFFEEREPISVHTLASAASQLTADLMKAKVLQSIVRSAAMVREERRREVLQTMAAPENFFKHADRDPEASLEFNPESTEFFIFASLAELEAVSGRRPREGEIYKMWFLLKHPGMLLENEHTKFSRDALEHARCSGLSADDKPAFLSLMPG